MLVMSFVVKGVFMWPRFVTDTYRSEDPAHTHNISPTQKERLTMIARIHWPQTTSILKQLSNETVLYFYKVQE